MIFRMKKVKTSSKTVLTYFVALAVAAVVMTGCSGKSETVEAAGMNVVNASPGSLPVSFTLNNTPISGPALAYNEQSAYFLVATGSPVIAFSNTTNGPITSQKVEFFKEKFYTVFLIGSGANTTTMFTNDEISAPPAGKTKIRFLNLSADAPILNFTTSDGTILFSNLSYKSVSDFIILDPKTYTFQIRNVTGGNALVSLDKTLEAGFVYTFYAAGLAANSGATGLSIQAQLN
jgi:hypothetical protein